ncbi:MAG: protease modulator HflK, partial [Ottowia sp.]|nr:protease modulator HflK [Ottowia sp.]
MTMFSSAARLPERVRGMFNLNDPRWGRDDTPQDNGGSPEGGEPPQRPPQDQPPRGRGPNQGPPDLDELWRDFNRRLTGMFGGRGGGGNGGRRGGGGDFQPDMKSAGLGIGVVIVVALLIWLGTGFFIVQEGQQAVVTRFGKYQSTVGAGFNWRLPYPIERHETVRFSQIRSVDVGGDNIIRSTGLRESAMLTEDENIVEIKFAVQYRLN